MTRFIESFATQQLVPPWQSLGVTTWGFVVRVPETGVRNYLDNYFNGTGPANGGPLAPAPFRYDPVEGPQFAFLTVVHHPGATSVCKTASGQFGSEEAGWNRVPNTQVYMTLPVLRRVLTPANLLVEPKVVWVQPFTYCDAPSVVFSAREIWGTDMQRVQIERDPTLVAPRLHLDAAYIGIEEFGPRSANELLAGIHLRVGEGTPADADRLRGVAPELMALLEQLVAIGSPKQAGEEGQPDTPGVVEVHNLKQFRAAEDMGSAIYRALVASRHSHGAVRDFVLHDPEAVEVDFMWAQGLEELLTGLLGLERQIGRGPPAGHFPVRPPPPQPPGAAPTEVRWDLDRMPITPELCFSFTSDVYFEVIDTLHVYRPQT